MVAIAYQICRELPDENYASVKAGLHKNHTENFMDESVRLMDGPRKEDDDGI